MLKEYRQTVNVSQVRHLSPFRYPGGKTWLVPHVKYWLTSLDYEPQELVEPFAGGGIISLTTASEWLAEHVLMIELDEYVASVWKVILEGDIEGLINKIEQFDVTEKTVHAELDVDPETELQKAFQTILRNRVSHGGIMAPGAGILKHGEKGKGLKSRWYPQTLSKRLRQIKTMRRRITFKQTDGLDVMKKKQHANRTVFFIDPPYTGGKKAAGKRLYSHADVDHEKLFDIAKEIKGDYLITYEDSEDIREMARNREMDMALVPMQNRHHAKMKELLIGNNLDWVRDSPFYHKNPNGESSTDSF